MIGILLGNLGTPDAPTPQALRRYLRQFLWDRRVVEAPRAIWWVVLHGKVLATRPREAARLYRKIWSDDGSPLLAMTRRQVAALDEELRRRIAEPFALAIGMRYGEPSLRAGLEELRGEGCARLLVLPLYPQYASATTASTFDAVVDTLKTWRRVPELRMIAGYHDHPGYIRALAESIRGLWEKEGEPAKLIFSFHGMPVKSRLDGDPYYDQCRRTARLVARELQLDPRKTIVCFQSRFGRGEWLGPKTDETLLEWAGRGLSRVDILCPGFAADCLETLEEIAMRDRELYQDAGGGEYRFIPCLNDSPAHVSALADLIQRNLRGWIGGGDEGEGVQA